MQRYTVAPGESLSAIAASYGLRSWRDIYDAPENAEFRRLRPDPAKIRVGDTFIVPVGNTTVSVNTSKLGNKSTSKINNTSTALNKGSGSNSKGNDPYKLVVEKNGRAITIAEITRKTVLEATPRLIEILMVLLKLKDKQSRELVELLKKPNDGLEALMEFWKAGIAYDKEKYADMTAYLLTGVGKSWNVLPAVWKKSLMTWVAKVLGRVPKLGGLALALPDMDRCGVLSSTLNLVGALIKKDTKDAAEATKELVKGMVKEPVAALKVAKQMMIVFFGVLPNHVKSTLAAKAAARKFAVVGTLIMSIADGVAIYEAYEAKTQAEAKAKKQGRGLTGQERSMLDLQIYLTEAGLGSTLAGLVPAAGTAISLIIDLGILVGTVIQACQHLNLAPAGNPAHQ